MGYTGNALRSAFALALLLLVHCAVNGQMRESRRADILVEYNKTVADYIRKGLKLPASYFSSDEVHKASAEKNTEVNKLFKKYKKPMSFVANYSPKFYDQVWIDTTGAKPVILFKVTYETTWDGEHPIISSITPVLAKDIKNIERLKGIASMWMPSAEPPPIVELK